MKSLTDSAFKDCKRCSGHHLNDNGRFCDFPAWAAFTIKPTKREVRELAARDLLRG